jgi:hypothetical protein
MTYFEAISIKQDMLVNMQYSSIFKKESAKALQEVARKYTDAQLAEALLTIKEHLREEYADVKKLFALAIASRKLPKKDNKK